MYISYIDQDVHVPSHLCLLFSVCTHAASILFDYVYFNHSMFGFRTTVSNHKTRLPLLFDTWITKVNTSQLFLVTDGEDPYAQLWMKVKGN